MVSPPADRTSGSRRLVAALIGLSLCAAIMLNGLLAWAAPGDRLGSGNSFSAAASQPDGKVVVAGVTDYECVSTGGFSCSERAIVVRFDRRGQLDPTFGGGDGIAMPTLTGNRGSPTGVLIGEGGLITIAFANALRDGEGGYSALARLHFDGSPDTSFGEGGGVEVLGSPAVVSMVALPGGRLLIYGTGRSDPGATGRIMRLERDGSIDSSFPLEAVDEAFGYEAGPEVGPDGKIYVAGDPPESSPDHHEIAILRFLPDGQPDPSFGEGGVAQLPAPEKTNPGYFTQIEGFDLGSDGRIVVTLLRPAPYKSPRQSELVRLRADGSLDGTVVPAEAGTCGGQVTVEPGGDILTADVTRFYSFYGFCVQEHRPSGELVAESKPSPVGSVGVMAVEPDGRVIAGGSYGGAPKSSAFVGLYFTAGLDREFGLAFLPRLGCRGRNPTEIPSAEPESGIDTPHAYGTHGQDVIVGTPEADTILGNAGADLICAGAGADRVFGGPGPDRVFGGPGPDRLAGGLGRDHLRGGPGRDRIKP